MLPELAPAGPLARLLLQILLILLTARLPGGLARRLGQPFVIGEMAAGIAGRGMGLDWNTSFVLGALMNTRGLMELIALNVGYDLGVISPQLFTIFVVMALTTTAMTGPLVDAAMKKPRLSAG